MRGAWAGLWLMAGAALAAPAPFPFQVEQLDPNLGQLPDNCCFNPNRQQGTDRSLGLAWGAAPKGAKSFAVLMVDADMPADATLLFKPDLIPEQAPRRDFYHWVLVDIPAARTGLPGGIDGTDTLIQGKLPGKTGHGLRGLNDFTKFLKGSKDMAGQYAGYDGPCPPVNDVRIHHYHIRLYALDVATLGLPADGIFDGPAAEKAIAGHVLAEGEVVGTYTNNPSLRN